MNLIRTAAVAATLVVVTLPAIATSGAWKWTDQSALLPHRDGLSVSMASARQNEWLVSDGLHLYRFDGSLLQDLTGELRARGYNGVSGIFSDNHQWLVHYQPIDRSETKLWLTDGQVWSDVSGKFSNMEGGVDAAGHDGVWYVRTYQKATSAGPAMWALSRWNGTAESAAQVAMPNSIATVAPGCFVYSAGGTLCTGASAPVFVNGSWYFIGGSSRAAGVGGVVTQNAKSGIWQLNGDKLNPIVGLPEFAFVSGIWPSTGATLLATSNSATNPFAADHLWLFDGYTLRDVTSQASSVGLLGIDAREIHAAWTGKSWMILAGKKLVRFDGVAMTDEGKTNDFFQTVSSDGNGQFVLGGAVSDAASAFATNPLTAKLVTVVEDLSAPVASVPLVSGSASALISQVYGPNISVSSNPADARIGNGKIYTFRATAQDQSGVDHVDIYVHGARVKSCEGNVCEYTQTYWTNGTALRKVELFARATNKKGYANDSAIATLVIDNGSQNSALPTANNQESATAIGPVPANQTWTQDKDSGINWTTWTDPNQRTLTTGGKMTYVVAANDVDGLNAIEIWVNGAVKRTCQLGGSKATNSCSYTLSGTDYPYGTEIFVNADAVDAKGKNAWTTGTRIQRDTTALVASVPLQPTIYNLQPTQIGPVFTSALVTEPNGSEIARGTVLKVHTTSQNNTFALYRVDVYLNGSVYRACNFGAAVSAVACDATIDTAGYNQGTNLSLVSRATDNQGHEIWSNTKSLVVRTTVDSTTAPQAVNGMSVWTWLAPEVNELSDGQTAAYSLGAWSPNGIKKIEMIVDGTVRQTCLSNTGGSRECSYTVSANDFSHGHIVSIGARATDAAGVVMWAQPHFITVKRSWLPVNDPGAYASVSTDHANGYTAGDKIVLSARGWSPNTVDHVDLYVNGSKVATCPAELCTWTSPAYANATLEYQARVVDRLNQETWSGLYGINRK